MELYSSNETTTNDVVELSYHGPVSVFVVFGGSLVLLIGIPTNLFLSAIIFSRSKLRNLNNFIIANIAVCGLIQLFFVIPWQFYSFITGSWPFAFWFCQCTFLLAVVTVDALMTNMAALALYRYFVVVRRQNYFLKTKKVVVTMVVCSWVISIVSSLIVVVGFSEMVFVPQYGRCVRKDTQSSSSSIVFRAISFFIVAKVVLPVVFSYPRIFYEVRKTSLAVHATNTDGTQNGGLSYRSLSRREVTITVVCVVNFLLFISCYGPIVVITIMYEGMEKLVPGNLHKLATLMYWIGNTLNLLVYAILQKETRGALFSILRQIKNKGIRDDLINSVFQNS